MNIRIPAWALTTSDHFKNFVNVPLPCRFGRFQVVRLDIIATTALIGVVGCYYLTGGWTLALKGAALFGFCFYVGLLIRGRPTARLHETRAPGEESSAKEGNKRKTK